MRSYVLSTPVFRLSQLCKCKHWTLVLARHLARSGQIRKVKGRPRSSPVVHTTKKQLLNVGENLSPRKTCSLAAGFPLASSRKNKKSSGKRGTKNTSNEQVVVVVVAAASEYKNKRLDPIIIAVSTCLSARRRENKRKNNRIRNNEPTPLPLLLLHTNLLLRSRQTQINQCHRHRPQLH